MIAGKDARTLAREILTMSQEEFGAALTRLRGGDCWTF